MTKIDVDLDLKEVMFKEIDIIQETIKRMNSNFFQIKGWGLSIILGTILLQSNVFQILFALLPLTIFWYLDAYYLRQERLFRELYKWVIKNRMKNKNYLFSMDTDRFKAEVDSKFKIMISTTIGLIWGIIALLIILYFTISLIAILS